MAADELQRRNLRPVVILLVAESFDGSAGTNKLFQQLTSQRIPVCEIYCDADISQALSILATNPYLPDVTSWQKPTLSL
jgi:hypothetical protein